MYKLSNPNASKEAVALLDYLSSVYGKKVISAHTKTPQQPELAWKNLQNAGNLRFEPLGYCQTSIIQIPMRKLLLNMENTNTIDTAIDWALNKGNSYIYLALVFTDAGHNKSF